MKLCIIIAIIAAMGIVYWYYTTKVGDLTFTQSVTPNPASKTN